MRISDFVVTGDFCVAFMLLIIQSVNEHEFACCDSKVDFSVAEISS